MAICSYCNEDKKLTREHVTPDFIYKMLKQEGEHYSWNSNFNVYKRNVENITKDVCAKCNNEYLSALDSYGKDFVEENKLHKSTYVNNLILSYNFNLLSRWLLKIAYNSARMTKHLIPDFGQYLSYIMNESEEPNFKYFNIIVELLKPHPDELGSTPPVHHFMSGAKLYTNAMCFGVTGYSSKNDNNYVASCIQISGVRFHLLFLNTNLSIGHASITRRQYMKPLINSFLLDPNRNICSIKVTNKTWVEHASTPDTMEKVYQLAKSNPKLL